MVKWGICAAMAAAVVFCQGAVRGDLLPVVDPIFSKTLVPYSWQATPYLAPHTWENNGPLELIEGNWVMSGVIVWQNPAPGDPKRIVGDTDGTHGLITDDTITLASAMAAIPTSVAADWTIPYQGCASLSAINGNEFSQTLISSLFKADKGYILTVAAGHNYDGGYPSYSPAPDVKLRLELFYTDIHSVRQTVGFTDFYNDTATGLQSGRMIDISTSVIVPSGAAVGQPIGILLETINPKSGAASGYFNVTNVRVDEVPEPATIAVLLAGSLLLLRRRPS